MFLLHARGCAPSARLLSRELGIPCGNTVPPTVTHLGNQGIIRWGSLAMSECTTLLNQAAAIKTATNKLMALDVMRAAGCKVTPFSTNPDELTWPLLGRSTSHSRGRDIRIYMQHADLDTMGPSDYYTSFIPKWKEFRVHVIGRRCTKLSLKEYQGGLPNSRQHHVAWNHGSGYVFVGRDSDTPEIGFFAEHAIPAVTSLGLDFGAVDMFLAEESFTPYITEVNTAPGIEGGTVANYARNLMRLIEAQS